jgi:hypothetical protein
MRFVRAFRREGFSCAQITAVLGCLLLAACQTDDNLVTGSTGPDGRHTIAFESIDGPPEPVFRRLVSQISNEADARKLPVISRAHAAAWRVRLYLAAHVQNKKAAISWVGDIYDSHHDRVFRVSGEEPVGPPRKDVWSLADDAVLARIAVASLEAIVIGSRPAGSQPAPSPEPAAAPAPAAEPPQDEGTPMAAEATVRPVAFAAPQR